MAIWLNGREKAFMYSENKLTHGEVQQAVNSMTYQGLQLPPLLFYYYVKKSAYLQRKRWGFLKSR